MEKHRWTNEEIAEYRKQTDKIFYVNKNDTRVMVPKAYGFGMTFNWGNPWTYAALVGIIALCVAIRLVFRY